MYVVTLGYNIVETACYESSDAVPTAGWEKQASYETGWLVNLSTPI